MTTTNKQRREAIIRKVQALLSKTTENGATEHEALAAADIANKLMEEHDLTYTDIEGELREDRYGARRRPFAGGNGRRRTWHEVRGCLHAIGNYWDCKSWYSGQDLVFFGSEHDSDAAHAMVDLLRVAIDGEFARYLKSDDRPQDVHGKTLRASFGIGIASRIAQRLYEIKRSRTQAGGTGSTALIVVKGQIVTEKYAAYCRDTNLKIRSAGRRVARPHQGAYVAGIAAGNRVDLGGSKVGASVKTIGRNP